MLKNFSKRFIGFKLLIKLAFNNLRVMTTEEQRRYPQAPLVGVGVVIVKGNEILLVKRRKEPGKGLWSIPGGLVLLGERLEEAAKREVKEETGLNVKIIKLIDVVDVVYRDKDGKVEYHYVIVDYLGKPVGGQITPGSDVEEVRWFKLEDVDQSQLTPTFAELFNRLQNLIS
ncbi:MAG: hypothetical protein DRJ33_05160 [Candidatus Methanomethylicota archaeon]|uniref:Nudix hydrolase domain-containing protein n=1 Tax=Thermoproteota archaeon TaxID=2056631 RepID=A0A497EYI9_9CREN|nr:MAG: hypothetical protein DRJ33_05160 [Candidatus Verstraetearchaeota archaeon]